VEIEGIGAIVDLVQRDLLTEMDRKQTLGFCNQLVASLECCNWLLEERLVEPGALLVHEDFKLTQAR